MDKIMIFGFSGAGKSTLAKRLGEKYNIEPTHMDKLHWKSGWREVSKNEQARKLSNILKKDRWIIDGNYTGTFFKERLNSADMIIFLDINRFVCLWRVIKRYFKYRGKSRPDMGDGCSEKLDFEFIYWVLFEGRQKRFMYYKMLGDVNILKQKLYVIKSPSDMKRFLKIIEE